MPLIYIHQVNSSTKIGVWHITEREEYFLEKVPLQREITHWHKRLQHLAGRLLLRELFPDFPVEMILIADTRKPYLGDEPFHFSISHCGDYAAVIVSRDHRVGVDIEQKTAKIRTIINKFLAPEEIALISPAEFNDRAILCWSVKESIFKWQGRGGVDFKRDIVIKMIRGDLEGTVQCDVKNELTLNVHFLRFNNNFLTWVLTE